MLVGTATTAVNKVAYGWNPDGNSASPFSPGKKGNGVLQAKKQKLLGLMPPPVTCDFSSWPLKEPPSE